MTRLSLEGVVACLTSPTREAGAAWQATTLDLAGGGIFGGELLGQAISIASQLDPTMPVRSVSAVFPRGVRDVGVLEFCSVAIHKGSAYSTQRVEVHQPDRNGAPVLCFSATVVCHQPAAGVDHGATMPTAASSPDDARLVDLTIIPWETRIVGDTDLDDRKDQPNELLLWMRVPATVGDELALHQSLLAYLSDLTLIGTALLQHDGWSQLDAHSTLRTSVITHQLVFHRPFRVDEWLLIHQTSPVAADGSAFGVGHVYTRDGRLVASITQESMIRVPG
ncbi:MAG: acyl-CoA thioesterase [Ilumatobacteraceae bacterium]|nr:acyl-CoA thioesterase [Ilumatobacteraceae bacterium]